MFKEGDMDLVFGGLALVFWLAIWGLARGCAALQRRRP
jgi:hypothetical protein